MNRWKIDFSDLFAQNMQKSNFKLRNIRRSFPYLRSSQRIFLILVNRKML